MMRYRLLGRSGLRVSELSLGTMTFGEDWGWGSSKAEAKAVFDAFAEAGGNFIDTANYYTQGSSERFVGEFVAADRDHFVVATKYSLATRPDDPNFSGNARKNMMRAVEESLERLNTDYIDLFYLHMWDYMTPIEEVMRAFDDLVRAGKILYCGISDTPSWVVSKANTIADFFGWPHFVAMQIPHSLMERNVEREVLPMARAHDMAIIPWGLLAGGVLTGKYFNDDSEEGRMTDRNVPAEDLERFRTAVGVLVEIANEIGQKPAQVAINWVRQQPGNVIPILGARRLSQVEDNLGCLEFELSEEQMQKLTEASGFTHGFPHDFLHANPHLFGQNFDRIDNHRRPY